MDSENSTLDEVENANTDEEPFVFETDHCLVANDQILVSNSSNSSSSLQGPPLCPLPNFAGRFDGELSNEWDACSELSAEEKIYYIIERVDYYKTVHKIPPLAYRDWLIELLGNYHLTLEAQKEGFGCAQTIELLNWILNPPWEEELIDSHKQKRKIRTSGDIFKLNDKQGVFLKDENVSLLHPAKACAVLSKDAKLTPGGAGRLLK